MEVVTRASEMKTLSCRVKESGDVLGFVPTMGYLHEGHLSLVRASRKECDITVVSVFVNPTQFGRGEDFDKYPRDVERDKAFLEKENVDILFIPEKTDIYPEDDIEYIEVDEKLTKTLCGASRPGHFKGVATVVAKLFDIVRPDKSYFGQKDAQQVVVIKNVVKNLSLPVEIKVMPTVREDDGLAMSSRNIYLSEDERSQAASLYKSLSTAKGLISRGNKSSEEIKRIITKILENEKNVKIDYVEIIENERFIPVDKINSKV